METIQSSRLAQHIKQNYATQMTLSKTQWDRVT